jgi:hypothetical protein
MNNEVKDFPEDERRREVVVVDRPTEVGIKLNNVLTALVLMVMSWVGYNIDRMQTQISQMSVIVQVQQNSLKHLQERMDNHIELHRNL